MTMAQTDKICNCDVPLVVCDFSENKFVPFWEYTNDSRLFPSELDLINLVYLEYSLEEDDVCVHACGERKKNDKKKPDVKVSECCSYMDQNSWRLLETYTQEGKAIRN